MRHNCDTGEVSMATPTPPTTSEEHHDLASTA